MCVELTNNFLKGLYYTLRGFALPFGLAARIPGATPSISPSCGFA